MSEAIISDRFLRPFSEKAYRFAFRAPAEDKLNSIRLSL